MRKLKDALPLKQFMVRQEVLQMYRQYLRMGRLLESKDAEATTQLRNEWTTWVKSEFRLRKNETDENIIRNLLVIGKRQLGELERSIRMSNG